MIASLKRIFVLVLTINCLVFSAYCYSQPCYRLNAQALYVLTYTQNDSTYVLYDSLRLFSHGEQHSIFNPDNLNYFYFFRNFMYGAPYEEFNSIPKPNNIDSGSCIFPGGCDSLLYFEHDNAADTNAYRGKLICEYNQAGLLLQMTRILRTGPANLASIDDFYYSYSNGNLAGAVRNRPDSPTEYGERFLAIDHKENVVSDSTTYFLNGIEQQSLVKHFRYDSLNRYIFLAEGNGINKGFYAFVTYEYSYYSDGKVKTMLSSNLASDYIDSFGYEAGLPGYSSRITYQVDRSTQRQRTWASTYVCHRNAFGLKDSIVEFISDNNDTDRFIAVTRYDSLGNPLLTKQDWYRGPKYYTSEKIYFHYEPCDTELKADEKAFNVIGFSPNPAKEAIYLNNLPAGKNVRVTIQNVYGQIVCDKPIIVNGSKMVFLLDNAISVGMHVISIYGSSGTILFRSKFIKL